MKKIALIIILLVLMATVTVVAAQTQYWYLLEGEDGYVICPTTIHVQQLAPNAIYMTCDGGKIYYPVVSNDNH